MINRSLAGWKALNKVGKRRILKNERSFLEKSEDSLQFSFSLQNSYRNSDLLGSTLQSDSISWSNHWTLCLSVEKSLFKKFRVKPIESRNQGSRVKFQKKIVFPRRFEYKEVVQTILKTVGCVGREFGIQKGELSVFICSDETMKLLNICSRLRNKSTDVLSFSALEEKEKEEEDQVIGDIVISIDRANKQAKEHHRSLYQELTVLTVHGFLHILGYDHETSVKDALKMQFLERRLLARLQNPNKIL